MLTALILTIAMRKGLGTVAGKGKQRMCRICKKRPPWKYKNCPPGVCKRCYHKNVWAGSARRPQGAAARLTGPDDASICLRAGDALELLGDREEALAYFEQAQQMAVASKDFRSRRDAAERIRRITNGAQSPQPTVERHQHRGKKSRSARRR